jgi:site-specific DNA-methyltransferase (adenine-specific)/modification methylase
MCQAWYKLFCGDFLSVLPTLEAGNVDAIITDPPYGLSEKWTGGTWFTKNVYANDKVLWDDKPPQETVEEILKLNKPVILWGGNYFVLPPSRSWLVWTKINSMPTMADCEMAWTNLDKPSKVYRSLRNGWNREHPTEKPIGLMKWCIEKVSNPGDTILDPFMGSGTTGVACMQLGRNFIGIEISPEYYAIAEKRIKLAQAQLMLEI